MLSFLWHCIIADCRDFFLLLGIQLLRFQRDTLESEPLWSRIWNWYTLTISWHFLKDLSRVHLLFYRTAKHVFVCLRCQLAQQSHSQTHNNARLFEVRTQVSCDPKVWKNCNGNAISCWIWLYLEEIFIDAFQTRTYTTAAFEKHVETTYMHNMAIHSEKLTITIHTVKSRVLTRLV